MAPEECVRIELELAWQSRGASPSAPDETVAPGLLVEYYLDRYPELREEAVALRLLAHEFRLRLKWGDRPTIEGYKARFPQWVVTGAELGIGLGDDASPESTNEFLRTLVTPPPTGHALIESLPQPAGGTGRSRYSLKGLHAEGGLGKIWVARDLELQREVALKELKPQYARHRDARRRFLQEAQVTGQLEHPNIVPVYELGRRTDETQPFYTMRLVRGETLRAAAERFHENRRKGRRDPLEFPRLLRAFVDVCNAISYAHSRGVIHRDLKPDNVVLGAFGEVLLLDWGLARIAGERDEVDYQVSVSEAAQVDATKIGNVLGTPAYMSPEQADGQVDAIDERTDIYGLGTILFELLTGRPPHLGEHAREVIRQIAAEPTPQARSIEATVPAALDAVCFRAMAWRREDRYQTAAELAREIERYLADEPISAYLEPWHSRLRRWGRRRRTLVVSSSVAAALLLMGALIAASAARREKERGDRANFERNSARNSAKRLAIEEMRRGHFASAAATLDKALAELGDEPGPVTNESSLASRREQVRRLDAFYRLSDAAEQLMFYEWDDEAVATCEAALAELGVGIDGDWPRHLPEADLTEAQQLRLREDVYRQLLLLCAVRLKPAIVPWANAKFGDVYRSSLEALAAAESYRPSEVGKLFKFVCDLGLGKTARFDGLGEPTCAADYYFIGMAYVWGTTKGDDTLGKLLRLGGNWILKMDFDRAVKLAPLLLSQAARLDPEHLWTHFWLGWALQGANDSRGAELAFNSCVVLRADFGLAYAYRGLSRLGQAREETDEEIRRRHERCALDYFNAALAHEPNNPDILILVFWGMESLKRTPDALGALARAIETEPPLSHWQGRRLHPEKQQTYRRTRDYAQRATQQDAANLAAWEALALSNQYLEDFPAAAAAAERALKLNGRSAAALAARAAEQTRKGEFEPALAGFKAALAVQPDYAPAALEMARLQEKIGPAEAALSDFDRLARVAKTDWQRVEAQRGRARLLKQLGRAEEARQAVEAAQEISPIVKAEANPR